MKNEILDDIFNDKLRNQLEKGEVVIWEGKPQFNNYNRLTIGGFFFAFMGINLFKSVLEAQHRMTWIIVIILIGLLIQIFLRQKKTRYLITNSRIIFQLPTEMGRINIQSLPLNQLEKITIDEVKIKMGQFFYH